MSATFTLKVLGSEDWDELDDNVDVQVTLDDGQRFTGTFFTIRNLESLFTKNQETGEFLSGTYLYAVEMVIVKRLTLETMNAAVSHLIMTNELDCIFTLQTDDELGDWRIATS